MTRLAYEFSPAEATMPPTLRLAAPADASIIAAFDYTAMVWAVALGLLLFGEAPSPRILAGAVIVVASGIFVLWREQRMRRIVRPSRPRSTAQITEKSLVASQSVR